MITKKKKKNLSPFFNSNYVYFFVKVYQYKVYNKIITRKEKEKKKLDDKVIKEIALNWMSMGIYKDTIIENCTKYTI